MRICLINPAWLFRSSGDVVLSHNLALSSLAAYLREKGSHDVTILDALAEGFRRRTRQKDGTLRVGLSNQEIIAALTPGYDLIGITVPFSHLAPSAEQLCTAIKNAYPRTPVILGGIHPSTSPRGFSDSSADYWLIGEGERALLSLANGTAPEDITGLVSAKKPTPAPGETAERIADLDEIPFPAYDLLPMGLYRKISPRRVRHKPSASLFTSRGCPWDCQFCSVHPVYGHRWRKRSAQHVLRQVEHLVTTYKVQQLEFEDDNLTIDYDRVIDICQGLIDLRERYSIDLTWGTPNGIRADRTLDRAMLELMQKSGCVRLTFALEHGDEQMREMMNKKIQLETFESNLRWAIEIGLFVEVFTMVGYPGETLERFENARRYYRELSGWGVNVLHFFYPQPYPGTELHRLCKNKGYLTTEDYALLPEIKIETEDFDVAEVRRRRELLLGEFDRSYRKRRVIKAILPASAISLLNRYMPRKSM